MNAEVAAIREGPWLDAFAFRATGYMIAMVAAPFSYGWQSLLMMLLGMWAYRTGLFTAEEAAQAMAGSDSLPVAAPAAVDKELPPTAALEDEDEGFEDGTLEDEVGAAPAVADKCLPPMAAQEMESEAPGAAPTAVMQTSPLEAAPEGPQNEDRALEDEGRGGGSPKTVALPSRGPVEAAWGSAWGSMSNLLFAAWTITAKLGGLAQPVSRARRRLYQQG